MSVLAFVDASDARLSGRVRAWRPPRWFCVWMILATRLGDGWAWLAAAILLLSGGDRDRGVLAAAALAAFLTNALQVLLKRKFRRRRPCEGHPHPLFNVRAPDCFSFPSGHTMNAFALAVLFALHSGFLAPLGMFLAASIAASRVVLGLHYVSDVLAGAVLGIAVGMASYLALLG